jgi:hypothetical protein
MDANGTPSDEQVINANEMAAGVADEDLAAAPTMFTNSLKMKTDIKVQIKHMNKRCKGHNWSENCNTSVIKALNKYTVNFYKTEASRIINGDDDGKLLLHQEG